MSVTPGPMAAPQEIAPNDDAVPTPRIVVGGPFNRWLNITMVVVIQGAEDPDSKIFMCEVCVARGTPFEECHISNYTNRVIGAPPNINETNCKTLARNLTLYVLQLGNNF